MQVRRFWVLGFVMVVLAKVTENCLCNMTSPAAALRTPRKDSGGSLLVTQSYHSGVGIHTSSLQIVGGTLAADIRYGSKGKRCHSIADKGLLEIAIAYVVR
jgi:hypothetical protein